MSRDPKLCQGMASILVVLAACSPLRRIDGGGSGGGAEEVRGGVSFDRGTVVLTGTALADGSGSVLATMAGKVPSFKVRYPPNHGCPEITLRSNVSFQSFSNPHVYVDGTRATDTCILETLRASNVERVEVCPQGYTTRPGYGTNAHGLILVFMRST